MEMAEKIQFVEVALALPFHKALTYSLKKVARDVDTTAPLEDLLCRRVLVPLSGRHVTGYIVAVHSDDYEPGDFKIFSISKLLDNKPFLHSNQLAFMRWVAEYYHYPLGMVIKAALPSGLTTKTVKCIEKGECFVDAHSFEEKYPSQSVPAWYYDLVEKGALSPAQTQKVIVDDKKWIRLLSEDKVVHIATRLSGDSIGEKKETCYRVVQGKLDISFLHALESPTEDQIEEFRQILVDQLGGKILLSVAKTLYQFRYLVQTTNQDEIPRRDLNKRYSGASKAIQHLVDMELVVSRERRVFRNPFGDTLPYYPRIEALSKEQDVVVDTISQAFDSGEFSPFLLHGVTGSGKTEVYLRAAEKALAGGKDVLVLVPEIALATQIEAHFVSRFDNLVVLQHSGLSPSQKYDQWSLALMGKAKIVIGARSAIFAPLKNLGLIIVDEEHDGSFKQDDSFCYNARDLSILRGRDHNAVVLLGSATPSITSFNHAKNGKYQLLSMKKRVGESMLPKVKIVDLGNKKDGTRKKGIFQPALHKALEETLADKKQAILLMNRRGFSAVMICKDCGEIAQCKHCNVSLTLHKGKDKLMCHYCGYSLVASTHCTACASKNLVPVGFGTERIEEEVQGLFPDARVARLDSDTAMDREKFLFILQQMRNGEIDILIGTQMIAKGHHFPRVVLVGVIWADGGMSMPDFRAAEKTYQLISQVTGRAGRGESAGRVVIQTMRPDHYAISYAKVHDYSAFYDHEMNLRANPAFPPYVRMIAFHLRGVNQHDVQDSASQIARFCRVENRDKKLRIEVLGPAPSPIERIKSTYRWQVLIKGSHYNNLHNLCWAVEEAKLTQGKTKLSIDVDPDNMM